MSFIRINGAFDGFKILPTNCFMILYQYYHKFISEVTCEYWQVLGFVVCIGMYGGMYCGTYWYVLTWYVLWHVLVCIIFGMYYIYW